MVVVEASFNLILQILLILGLSEHLADVETVSLCELAQF